MEFSRSWAHRDMPDWIDSSGDSSRRRRIDGSGKHARPDGPQSLAGADLPQSRLLHDPARHHDREHRDPEHHRRAESRPGPGPLGAERLHPGLRRPAHHGQPSRRPVRAAQPVRGRPRGLHGGLRTLRPGPGRQPAHRRPGPPGRRRRHADAPDAGGNQLASRPPDCRRGQRAAPDDAFSLVSMAGPYIGKPR